jgi:hypothetical protein
VIKARNDSLQAVNDSIRSANDSAAFGELEYQVFLDTVYAYRPCADSTALTSVRSTIRLNALRVDSSLSATNTRFSPYTVFTTAQRDSILAAFDSVEVWIDTISASLWECNTGVYFRNDTGVIAYNRQVEAGNDTIAAYNDSIRFIQRFSPYQPIVNGDTLRERISSAEAGDTIVVGAARMGATLRFSYSGTRDHPIVIQGQKGMTTVFDSADVVVSGNSYIQFRNIVFRGSSGSSVRLVNNSIGILFEQCRFDSNDAHGLEIVDSDARIQNCIMEHNDGSGIRVSSESMQPHTVVIYNSLIAQNARDGIEVVTVELVLHNVTISDNGGNGIMLADPELDISLAGCLVTFNGSYGVNFNSGFNGDHLFTVSSTNLYGNTGGAVEGEFEIPPPFLTYEVQYENSAEGNYAPAPGTHIYALEQEGIVIGYRER